MASINHLEMCDKVKALPQIKIKKTMFGLSSKVVYTPTGSTVRIKQQEYNADAGAKLLQILKADESDVAGLLAKADIKSSAIGNMRLEACLSDDKQFAAVQLLRFADFNYQPYSDVAVYEGKTAEAITQLFA